MENEQRDDIVEQNPQEEQPSYTPRPGWQVWLARICLVLFILLLIMYYTNMFRGGK